MLLLTWFVAALAYTSLYAGTAYAFRVHGGVVGGGTDRDAFFERPVADRAVSAIVINVVFVAPAMGVLFLEYVAEEWRGPVAAVRAAAVAALVYDALFWAAHRACHTDARLYARIHSVHHQWERTVDAASAFHAHPAEMALVNVAPLLVALWLGGADAYTALAVMLVATVMTQRAHSDPHGTHDRHHAHRTCQFGALGVVDALAGTRCSPERCRAAQDLVY